MYLYLLYSVTYVGKQYVDTYTFIVYCVEEKNVDTFIV